MYMEMSGAEIVTAPMEECYAIISYLVRKHKTLCDIKVCVTLNKS